MHGLLVLYTLIAAMYVYVLMYRPNMSFYRRRFKIRPAPAKAIRRAAIGAGVGLAAAGGYLASKRISERRAKARSAPLAAPVAAPIVTRSVAAPPPPPAQAPMMTPATAPASVRAPEVAPAMTPSADSPEAEDEEEEVGNNTDSGYMAEYPPLF